LLLTHGLFWAVIGALLSNSVAGAVAFLGGYLVLRLALAWTSGVWALRDETARRKLWLVPLRDVIHFAVWIGSFFSDRIIWGEAEFHLAANGEMVAVSSAKSRKDAAKPMRVG
jgi:ceramide glucosyltransferase